MKLRRSPTCGNNPAWPTEQAESCFRACGARRPWALAPDDRSQPDSCSSVMRSARPSLSPMTATQRAVDLVPPLSAREPLASPSMSVNRWQRHLLFHSQLLRSPPLFGPFHIASGLRTLLHGLRLPASPPALECVLAAHSS